LRWFWLALCASSHWPAHARRQQHLREQQQPSGQQQPNGQQQLREQQQPFEPACSNKEILGPSRLSAFLRIRSLSPVQ
jgi:hypothetical protein